MAAKDHREMRQCQSGRRGRRLAQSLDIPDQVSEHVDELNGMARRCFAPSVRSGHRRTAAPRTWQDDRKRR